MESLDDSRDSSNRLRKRPELERERERELEPELEREPERELELELELEPERELELELEREPEPELEPERITHVRIDRADKDRLLALAKADSRTTRQELGVIIRAYEGNTAIPLPSKREMMRDIKDYWTRRPDGQPELGDFAEYVLGIIDSRLGSRKAD